MEDIEKIFNDDIKNKKNIRKGVFNKTGKTGKIGTVRFPKHEKGETKPITLAQYNMNDIVKLINENSTLKEMVMSELDISYMEYRNNINRVFDQIMEVYKRGIEEEISKRINKAIIPLEKRINELENVINSIGKLFNMNSTSIDVVSNNKIKKCLI